MSHFSNVFLIVIDSLPFDHLDCNGYHCETSPAFIPSGLSITTQVGSHDIVPTILDLLEIPSLAKHHGEPLTPLLNRASAPERPALSQRGEGNPAEQKKELISFNTVNYKLIWYKHTDDKELYHLVTDPHEKNNIAYEEKEKCQDLQTQIKNLLQRPDETPFRHKSAPQKISLDEYLLKRLRGLGYIE